MEEEETLGNLGLFLFNLSDNEIEGESLSHKARCCKCDCALESELDLGSVFVLDYNGNFYCMNCDLEFHDGDERIFEAEFYED